MTKEDLDTLKEQTQNLIQIFEKNAPVSGDGTFQSQKVKDTILQMASAVLTKEQTDSLTGWMENHEFFTSPASAKYHANVPGGLAAHSLTVVYQSLVFALPLFENFLQTKRAAAYTFTAADIFTAALCHDFCKAGFYSVEHRKTKNYQGNWVYEPYYKVKGESRNLGHGNESVLMLLECLPEYLHKRGVLEAVSRHMGFSDLSPNETCNYSNFLQNPLVLLLQLADQSAAQWWDL